MAPRIEPLATFRPLIAPFDQVPVRVTGPGALIERVGEGLPQGAARAEAVAVRLRRLGVELEFGEPDVLGGWRQVAALCRARGRSSVEMVRADPSLMTEMQIGAWFQAGWRGRSLRRLLLRLGRPGLVHWATRALDSGTQLAYDWAFWAGVRAASTAQEWLRLTRSSYAALLYHRLAGEGRAGQERIDTDPRAFRAQLRLLRRLGFRHLTAVELRAFHRTPGATLPPRSFIVTLDDGFLDCREPLLECSVRRPQLFVCTGELGGTASWAGGEPLMDWRELRELEAAGVDIGAHGRRHERLTELSAEALAGTLKGSLADLSGGLSRSLDAVAYPHGAHDERVVEAARGAGFGYGYTTEKGRNGAGTDPFCLRRISVHGSDGSLTVLWKALTGQPPPSIGRPRGRQTARGSDRPRLE